MNNAPKSQSLPLARGAQLQPSCDRRKMYQVKLATFGRATCATTKFGRRFRKPSGALTAVVSRGWTFLAFACTWRKLGVPMLKQPKLCVAYVQLSLQRAKSWQTAQRSALQNSHEIRAALGYLVIRASSAAIPNASVRDTPLRLHHPLQPCQSTARKIRSVSKPRVSMKLVIACVYLRNGATPPIASTQSTRKAGTSASTLQTKTVEKKPEPAAKKLAAKEIAATTNAMQVKNMGLSVVIGGHPCQ